MANFEVLSLDPTTPQIRAPGAGDGYSVPRDMTVASGANLTLSGGTANGVLYLNGSKVATSGSALVFDGTNLGIGTASPANKLDINFSSSTVYSGTTDANTQFRIYNTSNTNGAFGSLRILTRNANDTAGVVNLVGISSSTDYAADFAVQQRTTGGNFQENLRLTHTGNLGIGTTSPAAKLEISASFANSAVEEIARISRTGGTSAYATSRAAALTFFDSSGSTLTGAIAGVRDNAAGNFLGGLSFYTASNVSFPRTTVADLTQQMVLTSSGNLGIGTTSPAFALGSGLEVQRAGIATLRLENSSGSNSIEIAADSTTNGIRFYGLNNAPFVFAPNATERARITSGGQFLVGTTTTSGGEVARFEGSANCSVGIIAQTTGASYLNFGNTSDANVGFIGYDHTNNFMNFRTNSLERARITSGGSLLVGKTADNTTTLGAQITSGGIFNSAGTTDFWNSYSTSAAAYRFYVSNAGTIFATNTTISAISDQRFKENIRDLDVGLGAILALKPRKFDWKAGQGKDIKDDRGFIAQEFEQVFPDLVDEWKDSAPEGEEPYKSVRQDLIPVLVKAMQEQQAMIEELKAKVAALEAR